LLVRTIKNIANLENLIIFTEQQDKKKEVNKDSRERGRDIHPKYAASEIKL
jgi:hypothetical protein